MGMFYDITVIITGIAGYKVIHAIMDVIFKVYQRIKGAKRWGPRMKNPPSPPKKKCSYCNGSGMTPLDDTSLAVNIPCLQCIGTGYYNPPKETGTG